MKWYPVYVCARRRSLLLVGAVAELWVTVSAPAALIYVTIRNNAPPPT
jgi:hypothetical protein